MTNDIFRCKKCKKEFCRQVYLDKHLSRKLPCDRNLICNRCGKIFTHKGDLNRHLNKKIPCEDNREIMTLKIQLEHERRLTEEAKVRQEELKIKQLMISKNQTAGRDINNNITNHNQITINNYNHEYNKSKNIVSNLIVSNDLVQTIQNFFRNQYNNPDYKENQCIQIKDNKIFAYIKTNTGYKEIGYADLKPHIKTHIRTQVDDIIQNHEELTEDNMIIYNIPQRNYIEDDKIQTVKKIPSYVNNERNNAIVKNQLKMALV